MDQTENKVDTYIKDAADFAQPVLIYLRALVHKCCPEVEETIKWGVPNFLYRGGILCNMAAFKQYCSFGFWNAKQMEDPDGLFVADTAGSIGRIRSLNDLPPEALLVKYIKAAVLLHGNGLKTTVKSSPQPNEAVEITLPEYLRDALAAHPKAADVFTAFSRSHKKEYIDWLEGAKTDATRNKRIAQALEWMAEGRSRNWKYK